MSAVCTRAQCHRASALRCRVTTTSSERQRCTSRPGNGAPRPVVVTTLAMNHSAVGCRRLPPYPRLCARHRDEFGAGLYGHRSRSLPCCHFEAFASVSGCNMPLPSSNAEEAPCHRPCIHAAPTRPLSISTRNIGRSRDGNMHVVPRRDDHRCDVHCRRLAPRRPQRQDDPQWPQVRGRVHAVGAVTAGLPAADGTTLVVIFSAARCAADSCFRAAADSTRTDLATTVMRRTIQNRTISSTGPSRRTGSMATARRPR